MAKAQITIFAILAVILLFVFGLIYYIENSKNQNQLIESKETIKSVNLAKSEIEEKIQSCMYEGSVQAIKLLGKQGGVFYKNQAVNTEYGSFRLKGLDEFNLNNPNSKWIFEDSNGFNYTIYIRQRQLEDYTNIDVSNERIYFTPPYYPCRSQLKNSLLENDIYRDMPDCRVNYKLENSIESISIKLDMPGLCNRNIPEGCTNNCICKCKNSFCENSIMSELEDYVSKYFDLCFKDYEHPAYKSSYRSGIDNSIISYIGLSNIYFVLNSQINFTSLKGDSFLTFKDVRSKTIYLKLASFFNDKFLSIINKESVLANYNLTDELKSYKGFKNLKIEKKPVYTSENPPNNKYNQIKLILDGVDGQLDGEPFEFIFLIENRIPVLQYIKKIQIPGNKNKFNISYRSSDPDEDKRIFDWNLMNNAEKLNTIQDPDDPFKKITTFKSKLKTGEEGILRLSVCDNSGLCDYQIIKIRQN